MQVIVKKAEKKDIPAIYEITIDAFKEYANKLGLPEQVAALKETYESIEKDLNEKIVLVAWADDKPVGSIRCEKLKDGNLGYISRFGVKPDTHNMGVGKSLVLEIEKEAKKRAYEGLTLHTASKMSSLVRFYYNMGFFIHSTTTDRGYIRAYFMKEF